MKSIATKAKKLVDNQDVAFESPSANAAARWARERVQKMTPAEQRKLQRDAIRFMRENAR